MFGKVEYSSDMETNTRYNAWHKGKPDSPTAATAARAGAPQGGVGDRITVAPPG